MVDSLWLIYPRRVVGDWEEKRVLISVGFFSPPVALARPNGPATQGHESLRLPLRLLEQPIL